MVNGFKFGEQSTWDHCMRVQHYPKQNAPARRMQTVTVPGRNGALHIQENSFSNYTQKYDCYFHSKLPLPAQAHAVKAWLLSSGAYQRLEDSYDPEHFWLAAFAGPLDIDNRLNRYGVCTVEFDCDPRAFLKSGENMITFTASGTLFNPTAFPAAPLIYVYGQGSGTVTVGTVTVEILSITDQLILDCELQNAYSQSAGDAPVNKNSTVNAVPFPELAPGENVIAFAGGITKVEIIPRWWEL